MSKIVLHGTYDPRERIFVLWAEQLAQVSGQRKRHFNHPFAASTGILAAHLAALALDLNGYAITRRIWLPSTENLPQPSPELISTGAIVWDDTVELFLRAWQVPCLALPVGTAVDFLLERQQEKGGDLRYWRALTLYALSLVASQRVIPALEKAGARLCAIWQPTPPPGTLAPWREAMPPVARALVESADEAAVTGQLVKDWIAVVVDHMARQAGWRLGLLLHPDPVGAEWLRALGGPDNSLSLYRAEATHLYQAWESWAKQDEISGTSAFRITFRLDAPGPDDKSPQWTLHYLLQATDDPGLTVTARQIWQENGTDLGERFERSQERLLAGLAAAARVFPPIERSLKGAVPEQASLSAAEAYRFLSDAALRLQDSGFRVLVPRWWSHPAGQVTARVNIRSSRSPGKTMLSLKTLLSCQWEVLLGGQPISYEEFQRLVQLKQTLVQYRGQWVLLDETQVALALKFFQRTEESLSVAQVLHLALDEPAHDPAEPPPGTPVEASGWFDTLLTSLKDPAKSESLPSPDTLHAQLRPYQVRGFSWLAFLRQYGIGACLADDMGLGKSIQTIADLLHTRQMAPDMAPALIVCPTSVLGNWRHEIRCFAPDLRILTHQGAARLNGGDFAAEAVRHDVVLTSYPLLARDRDTLATVVWSTIVLDEAQNIKNPGTRQAKAARALTGAHRIALTGTPVENRLSELWSIFDFLNPGYLGTETAFRRDFANPIERINDKEAARRLRQITAPFLLRRLKTDPAIVSDLPDKFEMKVYCTLTPEQGTLYQAVVNQALEAIDAAEVEGNAIARRGHVLAMLLKLKQICNHPAQFLKDGSRLADRSGKLARLTEMLDEVSAAGDHALVFTQFAEMGELLRRHLRATFDDEPLWLHGGVAVEDREAMIRRFQAPRGPAIFLLSLKAGGVGLNLTTANHVFHFDRWWNPAVEDQATDRAFRIGQTRCVQVHKFVCAGTLEERIDEMIASKKALAASVLGADESWLTELSTDSLRELVALRQADVELQEA